jgi:FeS assembly SUF system regulator
MLRITKLTDYAIVLLTNLAENHPQRQSAATLAQHTGIGLPTVSKLLKTLQKQHIVISHLGMDGGYQLVESPDRYSLAQIITAMEGPIALTQCNLAQGSCVHEQSCHVRPHWQRINRAVLNTLEKISLAEVIH